TTERHLRQVQPGHADVGGVRPLRRRQRAVLKGGQKRVVARPADRPPRLPALRSRNAPIPPVGFRHPSPSQRAKGFPERQGTSLPGSAQSREPVAALVRPFRQGRTGRRTMLYYPKIPGSKGCPSGRCIAFEKYDGTHLYWERAAGGWVRFGSRRDAFAWTD